MTLTRLSTEMTSSTAGVVQRRGDAVSAPTACAHAFIALRKEGSGREARAWWACEGCGTPFIPFVGSSFAASVDDVGTPEYLSVRELAKRVPYSEGTLRNLMSAGVLKRGVHYDKPAGRVIFRWDAMRAWVESARRQEAG